jgi:hypothetical protein
MDVLSGCANGIGLLGGGSWFGTGDGKMHGESIPCKNVMNRTSHRLQSMKRQKVFGE